MTYNNIRLAKEIFDKAFHNMEHVKLNDYIINLNKSDALEVLDFLNKLYINIIANPENFSFYDDFNQRKMNTKLVNDDLKEIANNLMLPIDEFRNLQLDKLNL